MNFVETNFKLNLQQKEWCLYHFKRPNSVTVSWDPTKHSYSVYLKVSLSIILAQFFINIRFQGNG